MNKKLIIYLVLVLYASNSYALKYNFSGITSEVGSWFQKLNLFALDTPEKRANDFYKNADKKDFDCAMQSGVWGTLSEGYFTANGLILGRVAKMETNKQLLVKMGVTQESRFICKIDDRNWKSGEYDNYSACIAGDAIILLCKRKN